jgi:YVTN family beta-propeller protein
MVKVSPVTQASIRSGHMYRTLCNVSIIVLHMTSVVAGLTLCGESVRAQRLLIVNKSGHTLSMVDPEGGRDIAVVPTGYAPHEVSVSLDGRTAYVTDYGTGERPGSTITIVDLATAEAVGTIALRPHSRPHGIAVASDGTLWVTTEGSRHLLHVDPRERRIVQAIETDQAVTHMVVVAEKHSRIYTANIGSGSVTAVDAIADSVIGHIQTGEGAEGLDVSPDGDHVYVTNRSAGTLVEIEIATNRVTRSLVVGDFPIRVKVRPDGREALVSNANANELVAIDLERWEVVRRLPVGAMPVGILVTPDNENAFVANTRDDKVSVIDLLNWRLVGELAAGDEPDGLAWVGADPDRRGSG